MGKSLGKGISEAVRNHIPIWVDRDLIELLYSEYQKAGGVLSKSAFATRISEHSDWVRKTRTKTKDGYERLYHCKTVQKASLIVHSPPSETGATGYVFCVDKKPIAGGRTKLKSVDVSTALSKNDKSTSRLSDIQFVKFTEADLQKMRIQLEFGDGFHHLETERQA